MKKRNLTGLVATALLLSCTKEQMLQNDSTSIAPAMQISSMAIPNVAGDDVIKYFGRWDFSDPTQNISDWGGAYLKVNFTGTTIKIKVGAAATNYYAKIDGGAWTTFAGVSGTVNLTPTPLAGGTHTLSVAQGKDYNYVFNFQGFVLDAGATLSTPSVGADIIEYIGDSITAGYTGPQADVSDYAWVAAEQLGAEHTQIAYPGIALVTGNGVNADKTGMESQYLKQQSLAFPSSPNWDFTKYTPKIVVIKLGQNDATSATETDSVFQSHYTNFLATIRSKFPNAQIFAMRTFMGGRAAPTLAAVYARNTAGDNNVQYIDTNGWLTPNSSDYTNNTGVHPSVSGHIKAANLLKTYLAPYLSNGSSVYIDHCDATAGWASGNTLTLNTGDKKEGTGSLQAVGSGTLEFQKTFTAINTGATAANGVLDFWYYVSDVTKLGSSNQIELGSGGTNDVNEYNWNIGTLVNGWNHITKTFSSAGTTGGTPNPSAINWFRIYHSKTAGITTKVDAIRVLH